ncbi:MAG: hypothetical protein WA865_09455 [Spirulinaceae cyanobacterium]
MSLLQSHPGIRAFEEIFPKKETKLHWGYANYPRSPEVIKLRKEQPIQFINEIA